MFPVMIIRNLLVLTTLCCLACKNTGKDKKEEKFDKVKWAITYGAEYPYRDNMLTDLITNYKFTGLKKEEIINLLGQPNRSGSGYLFYTIVYEYQGNIPVARHNKTLVIKLTNDSTVEWREIHE
jgi:hypothetical protein